MERDSGAQVEEADRSQESVEEVASFRTGLDVPIGESTADARHARTVLEVRGVAKRFGETRVLLDVDLRLRAGTVHGVIGANGAGKTTLMRILMGETRADAGTFDLGGRSIDAAHWSGVETAGGRIAMVHQEIPVFDNLRVFEHFALEQSSARARRVWRSQARRDAAEALSTLFPGSSIRARSRVLDLTLGQRQMLDITLAMSSPDLEILVLDEPTSALDREQANQLKSAVDKLRARGVAILLVTHRLEELLSLCDEVTVLRDGNVATSGPASEFDAGSLVVAMGGAAHPGAAARTGADAAETGPAGDVVATVTPPDGNGLALELRRGEIVGLTGLSGSGQSELVTAVARDRRSRWISVRGSAALVSGDRRGSGIFPLWSTLRNVTVGSLGRQNRIGAVLPGWERSIYTPWKDRLQIRAQRSSDLVTTLSGGNQQKVLIARALASQPQLLVLDDPTRGVDASTKFDVYGLLRESAAQGMAVLWYSTEDDEMLQCDRAYVMRDGMVEQELRGAEITREAIVSASFAAPGEERERSAAEPDGPRSRWMRLLAPRGWSLIALVLIALIVATGIQQPSSLTASGLPVLTSSFTPLVFAAVAEMMIISVSDIDLGVGAFMGLINAVSATWLVSHPVLGVLGLAGFFLAYVFQGFLVAVRRVPAIIVTLGFSFIWLGLGLVILPVPGGSSPNWLTNIGAANISVPEPLIISLVVAVLGAVLFFRTRLGIRIRALGNNADAYAVRSSSLMAVRERVVAWALAGVFAVLAGLSVTALTSSADPSASQPDTLLAIAAVIVGGGEFFGGFVEPVGAVLGALMFGLLEAYLALTSINVNYTSLVEGAVLIGVLGLRLLFRRRHATAFGRRSGIFAKRRSIFPSGASMASGAAGPEKAGSSAGEGNQDQKVSR